MSTLIRRCQVPGRTGSVDVRLRATRIAQIAPDLAPAQDEHVIDAGGGALLPGLHDHHIHLVALAAALSSVHCGPPEITDAASLGALLRNHNSAGDDWLRGIGYHPSVAGDIDRHWLDRHIPDRPARIQHRGGRLWVLNSKGLAHLQLSDNTTAGDAPQGVEYHDGAPTGRLLECDTWLRQRLGGTLPCLSEASALLASVGITGITDTTPSNGPVQWAHFAAMHSSGKLRQTVRMMGGADLPSAAPAPGLTCGEYKVHLLESQLPAFEALVEEIEAAHRDARAVAVHCVTRTELVFTLAALEAAGSVAGDRIEHASVTAPDLLESIAALGLRVVSQPHFVAERGDQYLAEVDAVDIPSLYRLRSFSDAQIPLAAGSDAPFGTSNPWIAMQAAVERQTRDGASIGAGEALSPEAALALYTGTPQAPGLSAREVAEGATADLCLLATPWEAVRDRLADARVQATWIAGELAYLAD